MTPAQTSRAGRRRRGPPRLLMLLGWVTVATLVALSRFAPPRPDPRLGPPSGRLAEGLPALPDSAPRTPLPAAPGATPPTPAPRATPPVSAPPVSPPPAARTKTPVAPPVVPAPPPRAATPAPRPAAAPAKAGQARRLRLLAEVESVFAVAGADAAADADSEGAPDGRARDWRRELPRPFSALRRTASPLIMPRLGLPRVLSPDFVALRGLAARARPGEAVHVRLTAYCLNGRTRHGTLTRAGVVAADPRIFPLTRSVHLYAAGRYLGRFRVEDTGSGVRGPHIDIWTPDCADARKFGSRAGIASLVGFGKE